MDNTHSVKINVAPAAPWGMALFITFLVLKLTHVIDWSWWWVTAPVWGPFALVLAIWLFALAVIGVFAIRR